MSKNQLFYKIVPIFLIVSILFTACDVPDISEFTTQSAEMTRGMRKGVKDLENILQEQFDDKSAYEKGNQKLVENNLISYRKAMKPTLKTLDSLDGYLEALNALSQANKKSGENAKAAVNSMSKLVTAVSELPIFPAGSALKLGESTVNIATGLVALEEKFRTARSFKNRVNLAADIVEGRYIEVPKTKLVNGKTKEVIEVKKLCSEENKGDIEKENQQLAKTIERIEGDAGKSDKDKKILVESARENSDKAIYSFGCGVIDLLKFTVHDLKQINKDASTLIYSNYKDRNKVTPGFFKGIVANDTRTQRELTFILSYKNIISIIKEDEYNDVKADVILEKKRRARQDLEEMFMMDGTLKTAVAENVKKCDDAPKYTECLGMLEFVNFKKLKDEEDEKYADRLDALNTKIGTDRFEIGDSFIETVLENRADRLYEENKRYLAEKERINSDNSLVEGKLAAIKKRQNDLDKAFETSLNLLDSWAEAHSNLRISLNTKKPFSVAKFTAQVKELWSYFEPETK